jgi:hypothetical protein
MGYRVCGAAAQIRWGHFCAATLGAWTLDDGALTATVERLDTFRVTQRPLVLVIGSAQWPLESLEVSDRRVTGRVSPQGR